MTSVAPDAGGFPATLTVELSDPNTYGLRERMWDARGLASVQLPLLPLLPLLVGGGGCRVSSPVWVNRGAEMQRHGCPCRLLHLGCRQPHTHPFPHPYTHLNPHPAHSARLPAAITQYTVVAKATVGGTEFTETATSENVRPCFLLPVVGVGVRLLADRCCPPLAARGGTPAVASAPLVSLPASCNLHFLPLQTQVALSSDAGFPSCRKRPLVSRPASCNLTPSSLCRPRWRCLRIPTPLCAWGRKWSGASRRTSQPRR